LITLILSLVYGIIAKRMVRVYNESDETEPIVFWVFGGAVVLGFWIGTLVTGGVALDAMINPEYWALQEILTSITGV